MVYENEKLLRFTIKDMNIYQRSDGRFMAALQYQKNRKFFYGKTKNEVREKARCWLKDLLNNKNPIAYDVRIKKYTENFLKEYEKRVQPSTYGRTLGIYHNYILKGEIYKKNMRVADVRRIHIQEEIDKYTFDKHYSLSTIKKIKGFYSMILQGACMDDVIAKNPCMYVVISEETGNIAPKREQRMLDDEEIRRFTEIALRKNKDGDYISRNNICLLLMLNLGVRPGEILALTWGDLDFDNRSVTINKILQSDNRYYHEDGSITYERRIREGSSKTKNGVRVLALSNESVYLLNILKEMDKRNGLPCGDDQLVVHTRNGEMTCLRNMTKSLDYLLKRADIKDCSLYTLRHTFASVMALSRGVDTMTVAGLMGHHDDTVTKKHYLHLIEEANLHAMAENSVIKIEQ